MAKSNYEVLDNLYRNFDPKKAGYLDEEELSMLNEKMEISRRSRIEVVNLKEFNILFFEHKIIPIYSEIDGLICMEHIKEKDKFDELMNKRDHARRVYDAVDSFLENLLFRLPEDSTF